MRKMSWKVCLVGLPFILLSGAIVWGVTVYFIPPKFVMVQDGPLGWGPCLRSTSVRFADSPYGNISDMDVASMVANYCQGMRPDLLQDPNLDDDTRKFVKKAVYDGLKHDAAIMIERYRAQR